MIGLLTTALALSSPADPRLVGAERFLRHVYAGYAHPNSKPATFDALATPQLRALIARDETGHPGEVGDYDDIDWVCRCQDWTSLHVSKLTSRREGAAVIGRVTFSDAGDPRGGVSAVTYRLVQAGASWRIADVMLQTATGERWATAALAAEIRTQRRR